MKPLILSLGLLLSVDAAVAQEASPPNPIQAEMKQISADFKAIGAAVTDPTKNATSAASARDIENAFKLCLDQVPDAIAAMPAADQAAAISDYKSIISDEITQSADLVTAFNTNDNAGAATILKAMSADKTEGHGKYNP